MMEHKLKELKEKKNIVCLDCDYRIRQFIQKSPFAIKEIMKTVISFPFLSIPFQQY